MSANGLIRHIVIVGGGTAGWLTANHLAKALNSSNDSGIKITLIESPNIPTIGVGEGTVPMMRQTLQYFGISETDFIQQCNATFKQGIRFNHWLHNPSEQTSNNYYHHIFDYAKASPVDLTRYWLAENSHSERRFVDAVSIQGKVCDQGLAPKFITTPEFQGLTSYAYHLDAAKFSSLLKKNAIEKLAVNYIEADVCDVLLHDNGAIRAVVTKQQGEISADFFVDCSGFRSLLLGEALKVPFVDKSDVLFADYAVTMQLPDEKPDQAIASYTIATAQTCGWIWDIGLQTRRGIGHVYSSKYISHDEAEQQLRDYAGSQGVTLPCRKISMNIGYREQFWQKNCVAIGLSQGFVEPLEATGLLVFDATAKMLAQQFPSNQQEMTLIAQQFNRRMLSMWLSVIDFIKLHYCLSKRTDSDFWLDNQNKQSIPESLQEKLDRWQFQPPSVYDFDSKFDIFNIDNYRYVLYGMQFNTNAQHFEHLLNNKALAQQEFNTIAEMAVQATDKLPKHRALINKILQFGLQSI